MLAAPALPAHAEGQAEEEEMNVLRMFYKEEEEVQPRIE
jgi:hypothetical protein